MDIQLKKSGIGVKEKKSKNHLLYSIKQNLFAYAMLIPTFVCMMCIHFIPMLQGIYMSLLDLNQLKNYYEILFDEKSLIRRGFWFALRNTAIYTVVVTFATFALGIILALLMPWVVPLETGFRFNKHYFV